MCMSCLQAFECVPQVCSLFAVVLNWWSKAASLEAMRCLAEAMTTSFVVYVELRVDGEVGPVSAMKPSIRCG